MASNYNNQIIIWGSAVGCKPTSFNSRFDEHVRSVAGREDRTEFRGSIPQTALAKFTLIALCRSVRHPAFHIDQVALSRLEQRLCGQVEERERESWSAGGAESADRLLGLTY